MEDMIASDPEHFLSEAGLVLSSRQLSIGHYRFDLLFRDRHDGKLLVELQRGTLDRNHTYKILDYYDEYKSRHPEEFVDVMVVANMIPSERKQRLRAHGIEFREIPIATFIAFRDSAQVKSPIPVQLEASNDVVSSAQRDEDLEGEYHFKSLGPSEFIKTVRKAFESSSVHQNWKFGGNDSLTAIHLGVRSAIKSKEGTGLFPQIWMERPKQGLAVCKFEIAGRLKGRDIEESNGIRLRLASSIRNLALSDGLPGYLEEASGSTMLKCRANASRQQTADSDGVRSLITFLEFLDSLLEKWLRTVYKTKA